MSALDNTRVHLLTGALLDSLADSGYLSSHLAEDALRFSEMQNAIRHQVTEALTEAYNNGVRDARKER
jgi:hypothetical protein